MTRDAAKAVEAEVDRAFPGLRDNFGAKLLLAEPEASPDLNKLRAEVVVVCREIGTLQTGRPVDMRWIKQAAAMFMETQTGESGWDFTTTTDPRSLVNGIAACKAQLLADKGAGREADSPF